MRNRCERAILSFQFVYVNCKFLSFFFRLLECGWEFKMDGYDTFNPHIVRSIPNNLGQWDKLTVIRKKINSKDAYLCVV